MSKCPTTGVPTRFCTCIECQRPAQQITGEEWARRFKARIVARLTEEGSAWTPEQAEAAAQDEYGACSAADMLSGYENDPEGSADMALSYWTDDGDE